MKYLISYKAGDKEKENVFLWRKTFLGRSILLSLSVLVSLALFVLLLSSSSCLLCACVAAFLSFPIFYLIVFLYIIYVNSPFYFSYGGFHDRPVVFEFDGTPGDLIIDDGYRITNWRDGKYKLYRYESGTMVVNGLVVHYIPSSSELHEYI